MKTFRLFVALLFVALLAAPAFSQDNGEIAALLAKARRGNGIAQYNLGLAYAEGKGVPADPVEAYVWLSLARENGARGRALDNLMGTLDKNSLEQAQHRLTERKTELGVHTPSTVNVRTNSTAPAPAVPAAKETVTAPAALPAKAPDVIAAAPAAPTDPAALAAEVTALRAERDRLINASAEREKTARAATDANQALQEQARTAEAKAAELARTADTMKGELARARLALTAAQKAATTPAKPAAPAYPDLTGRVAELEAAYTAASTNLAQAQAALAAKQAAPAAPSYPDLSGRVTELEAALAAKPAPKPAAPAYPDLSGKVADLESQLASLSSEATHAKQEMAALSKAKDEANAALKAKPAPPSYPDLSGKVAELQAALAAKPAATDSAALAQKSRELQAALADLEEARTFGRKVEDTLNKVNDDKARVAAAAAAELAEARAFGAQVENTLNKVSDQKAALEASLRAAESARDSYAKEFATAKAQLAAANSAAPAAPAYPDLSGKVAELQTQLAKASSELSAATTSKSEALAQVAAATALATAAKLEAATLSKAKPSYPDLSGRVAELEKTNAALKSEAVHAQQEAATLAKANDALKARPSAPSYPDLSGKVAELQGQVTKLSSDLSAATATKSEAEKQMAALAKAKDEALAALAAKPSAPSYPDLRPRVSELETKLAATEKSLAAKPAAPAYPDLRGNVTELEAKVATLTAESTRAKQEMAALTKAKDDVAQSGEASVRSLSRELETTKSALAQANDSLRAKPAAPSYPDLTGRVAELESAYTAASTNLAQAQAALAAKPVAPSYPDLRERVAKLESDLTAARATTPAAPAYPDLSGKVAELTAALAAKSAAPAYPNLSGKVTELEAALAAAAQKATAADQARSTVAKEFDDYKNATAAAQRERTTLLANVKLLESDKVSLRRQAESAGTESAQLRTQVATLKEQLAAKPSAPGFPDLRDRVAKLESDLTAARAAPAYPDLAGTVADLQGQLARANDALKAKPAAPAYPDLSGKVAELTAALAAKPTAPAYPDLSGKVTELEAALAAKPAAPSFPDLRERVTQLEGELTAARTASPSYPDLRGRVAGLEADLSTAKQLLAAKPAAPAYPDLSAKVAELEASLRDSTRQVATASTEADRAHNEIAQLNKALAEKPKAVEPAYPDYTNLVKEMTADVAKLRSEREQQAGELAAGARRVQDLQNQVGMLQATVAAKPAAPTYPDLSGQVAELQAQLAKQSADLAAAATAKSEADKQIAALTKAKQTHSEPITAGDSSRPDLSGKVAELTQQLAAAENASKIKSDYVSELEGKLRKQTAAVQEAGKAKGTVDSLTREVTQLREDRERMQKAIADTGRKLRDSSADATRIKELETQAAGLQSALTNAQSRATDLQAALAAKPAAPAYPDLSGKVAELEAALAAKPVSPGFPDLRERVTQLERDLASARASAPAYPDLSSKVAEQQTQLAKLSSDLSAVTAAKTEADKQVAALTKAKEKRSEPITAGDNYRPDLSGRVRDLEAQLAAAKNRTPAYPDLSGRVRELESQLNDASSEAARAKREAAALAKAKEEPRQPAYPDLRSRVAELEAKLAQAASQPAAAPVAQTADTSDLQKRLTETEDRLATSLRGYALLEKERDALQAKSGQASEALTAKVAALTSQVEQLQSSTAAQATNTNTALAAAQAENARLSESLAALQRSTGQVVGDAASNRALVQQLQGANSVLAQENYQLKTVLARATGGSAPTAQGAAFVSPAAARIHIVASGDSLSKLSQRYYGTAGRWQEIYNANAAKLGPNGILRVGTELRIP